MSTANTTIWTSRLAVILERLIELQDAMHRVIRDKLEAMRRSDVDGMLAGSRSEREIAEKVERLNEERLQAVNGICAALQVPVATSGRGATLRSLTARLDADTRQRLSRLGAKLRERMLAVGEANRTAELVCREMLAHFKTLFTAMVRDDGSPVTYRRDGETGGPASARVLDAVG